MSALSRREFLRLLAMASAAGLALDGPAAAAASASGSAANATDARFYDLPGFGNVSLLHFTDSQAQLLPVRAVGLVLYLSLLPEHLLEDLLLRQLILRVPQVTEDQLLTTRLHQVSVHLLRG